MMNQSYPIGILTYCTGFCFLCPNCYLCIIIKHSPYEHKGKGRCHHLQNFKNGGLTYGTCIFLCRHRNSGNCYRNLLCSEIPGRIFQEKESNRQKLLRIENKQPTIDNCHSGTKNQHIRTGTRNVFDKPGIDPVLTFSLPAPYLLLLSTLAMERQKNGQNRGEICKGTGPRTKKTPRREHFSK